MSDEILKWALPAAAGAIIGLLVFILTGFRQDIQKVQIGLEDLKSEVHKKSYELATAIATIGGKLDQLGKKRWL